MSRIFICSKCSYLKDVAWDEPEQLSCPRCGKTFPKVEDESFQEKIYLEISGKRIDIQKPIINIGRSDKNDVIVKAAVVSRRHLQIEYMNDGWYVKDRGSKNGTYLDDMKLICGNKYHLHNQDCLILADREKIDIHIEKTEKNENYIIKFVDPRTPFIPYYSRCEEDSLWTELPKRGFDNEIYYDPIEDTMRYKQIEKEVDKLVEEEYSGRRLFGSCHGMWKMKKKILKEKYGIDWHSIGELNPGIMFD